MNDFFKTLQTQRWDDHRYYHHSRINQTLHLISAISFVVAYALLWTDPVLSALIAWLVSMTSRQAGHFFFEPRGYDHVNQASHEHKEAIKRTHRIDWYKEEMFARFQPYKSTGLWGGVNPLSSYLGS